MKLESLRYVAEQIDRDLEEGNTAEIYYRFNDEWRTLSDQALASSAEVRTLNLAQSENVAYRGRGKAAAWFAITSLDCVVAVNFPAPPTSAKTSETRKLIDSARERAQYLFRAAHNPLTLLLAKDAFHDALTSAIAEMKIAKVSERDSQENLHSNQLAVFALDIDYFKQINDTYGHLYGDQVLKTFGRRLELVANEIVKSVENRVSVYLGHPSGEEFLVFVVGNCSRDEVLSWAEQFRAKIADEILPTHAEWEHLNAVTNLTMIALPVPQDRSVRASIGVTFRSVEDPSESEADEAKFLLERADTALYKAKSGGRNQVVEFDEILSSYGRVLEQDNQTRIVAVDIGSNVGVLKGQEFKVYTPSFTGKAKFQINDGRTTRTLGLYPRVELTRITVFDVQAEISFAFVTLPEDKLIEIPPSSYLEAIPVGSVSHIAPYTTKYFSLNADAVTRDDIASIKTFLKEQVEQNGDVFSVVFRFTNEKEYVRKYGSAALNLALTQLYRNVLSKFRSMTRVAVLDEYSIGLVGAYSIYRQDVIEKIVDDFYGDFAELGLSAGVYYPMDDGSDADLVSKLDPNNAVEFSQFAASQYGRDPGAKLTRFDFDVALRLIANQRKARAFTSGQADFEKLIELGVVTAQIYNEGGLIYSTAGSKKAAAEQYESALSLEPKNLIFRTNLAAVLGAVGEQEKALKFLDVLTDEQVSKLIKLSEHGSITYTVLLARAKDGKGKQYYRESRFRKLIKAVNGYGDELKEKRKNDYAVINSLAL